MTIAIRRVIYIAAIILFIIIGSLAALFASGYRVNIKTGQLMKVGALYVKSYPAGAKITIDGKMTTKTTPARFLNVLPGMHSIVIAKDTLYPWHKELEVVSGQTTFVRDVVLFKYNPEPRVLSAGGDFVLAAVNKSIYLFKDTQRAVHITNTFSGNDFKIVPIPLPDRLIALSPSNDTVLYEAQKKLYMLDVNTEKTTPLPVTVKKLSRAMWDVNVPTRLWLLADGTVTTLDLTTGQLSTLYSAIDDFFITGSTISLLTHDTRGVLLSTYAFTSDQPLWTATIATNDTLTITNISSHDVIALQGSATVWIVDQETANNPVSFDATHIDWNGERAIIANDFEIYTYDTQTHDTELIDRTSEHVRMVTWHPNGSYFIRQLGQQVEIVELDSRGIRNTIPVYTSPEISYIIFDAKGERLYAVDTITNREYAIQ